jgi:hypothetical protein
MSKQEYIKYLNTEHWKTLRNKKVAECYRCFVCHNENSLVLHHMNYNNLGKEEDKDTVVLCNKCHFLTHFGSKKFRKQLKKKFKKMLRFKGQFKNRVKIRLDELQAQEREEYELMINLENT